MLHKDMDVEQVLHFVADSAKMPGFQDELSQLLEEEAEKRQAGLQDEELEEEELAFAAGGASDDAAKITKKRLVMRL